MKGFGTQWSLWCTQAWNICLAIMNQVASRHPCDVTEWWFMGLLANGVVSMAHCWVYHCLICWPKYKLSSSKFGNALRVDSTGRNSCHFLKSIDSSGGRPFMLCKETVKESRARDRIIQQSLFTYQAGKVWSTQLNTLRLGKITLQTFSDGFSWNKFLLGLGYG